MLLPKLVVVPHCHTIFDNPLFASFTVVDNFASVDIVLDTADFIASITGSTVSMFITFNVPISPIFVPSLNA